jgi:hypothetical protein
VLRPVPETQTAGMVEASPRHRQTKGSDEEAKVPERWNDIEILREVDRQQFQYGGGPLIPAACS